MLKLLSDKYCEDLAYPDLFPADKFGCNMGRDIPSGPSKCFGWCLWNFMQTFD